MADKRGREWGDSSSETETESDSGDTHSRNKDQKQTKKKNIKPDTPKSGRKRTHSSRLVLPMFLKRSTSSTAVVAIQISRVRKEASMMLPNTQVKTPLEARAVGARLSAFGAKRASLFLLKRGWNVCMSKHVYKLKWPCQRITLFSLSIALSVLRV